MAALTALLARDRVVSAQKIDEAIQRQVIDGGDLETNLLEIDALGEDVLTSYCAALYNADPALRGALARAQPEALALASRSVAVQWQLVPLAIDGGVLALAMVSPPGERERQELERTLGRPIAVRIATPFRVAWGLWKHYGLEMAPRLQRLAQRMDARPSGWMPAVSLAPAGTSVPPPAVAPPARERPAVLAGLAALSAALDDEDEDEDEPTIQGAIPEELRRVEEPADEALEATPLPEPEDEAMTAREVAMTAREAAMTVREAAMVVAQNETAATPARDERWPTEPSIMVPELLEAAAQAQPAPEQPEPAVAAPLEGAAPPAMRSLDECAQRLGQASDRDGMVRELLAATEGRAAYAALFVAHGDFAEGHESHGAGPDASALKTVTVSMETGSLRVLREVRVAVTATLRERPADRTLFQALQRAPEAVLVLLPVLVSGRVVLVLALDGGPGGLDGGLQGELARLCVLTGQGLEKLILERKRKRIGEAMPQRAAAPPESAPAGPPVALPSLPPTATMAFAAPVTVPSLPAARASAAPAPPPARSRAAAPTPPQPGRKKHTTGSRYTERDAEEAPEREAELRERAQHTSAPSIESAVAAVLGEPLPPPEAQRRKPAGGGLEESTTRFARGGRVPIAVDVVGPLPEPMRAPGEASRPARPSAESVRETARSRRLSSRPPPPMSSVPRVPAMPSPSAPTGLPMQSSVTEEALRLAQEVVRSNSLTDAMAQKLLGYGERALPALFRFFPGPTQLDRSLLGVRLPLASDCGPLLRMVVLFRSAALPYLVEVLRNGPPDSRLYAVLCLGETVHSAALTTLRECLYDADSPTRAVTIEVLRHYRRFAEFDTLLGELRSEVLDSNLATERRRLAARAVGELRDAGAPPVLIAAMADADGMLASAAHRSLTLLTRQDFGTDLDAWQAWWQRVKGQRRVQWLIDALLHDDASTRHEASEELKKLTGQFFGFYFNLPRREREKAWRRYQDWWEREGAQSSLR